MTGKQTWILAAVLMAISFPGATVRAAVPTPLAGGLRRPQRNHGPDLGRGGERTVPQVRRRSARAADPQRADHDGDPGLGRHAARLGGAEQRAEHLGERAQARLLRRRQQPGAAGSHRQKRHRVDRRSARQKLWRAEHRRRLLDLDHGRAGRPRHRSRTNTNSTCASSATPPPSPKR